MIRHPMALTQHQLSPVYPAGSRINDAASWIGRSMLVKSNITAPDAQGNYAGQLTLDKDASALSVDLVDSSGNLVWNSGHQLIAALGVTGLVIAVTGDVVLVMPRERAQDVRELVARLQNSGRGHHL